MFTKRITADLLAKELHEASFSVLEATLRHHYEQNCKAITDAAVKDTMKSIKSYVKSVERVDDRTVILNLYIDGINQEETK